MKLTIEELKDILSKKPILTNEAEINEAFALLGFKLKEYNKAGLSQFQRYEVHHRRTYLIKVEVDESRCLSLSNEYIDFSDGCHGVSFGGIDTVTQLIQTVILIAQKVDRTYTGQISFNEDESEYTEQEFMELLEVLNEEIFNQQD
jgi:hypothetical protein